MVDRPHLGCNKHRLFYCSNCWMQFPDSQRKEEHKRQQCNFRCVTEKCTNYDKHSTHARPCRHGRKNESIWKWKRIYRMAHRLDAHVPVPEPSQLHRIARSSMASASRSQANGETMLRALSENQAPDLGSSRVPGLLLPNYVHTTMQEAADTLSPQTDLVAHANNQLMQRLRSLQGFALWLWELISVPEPTWDAADQVLYDVITQPVGQEGCSIGDQSIFNQIRQLEALLQTLRHVLEDPAARTAIRWRALRRLAMMLIPGSHAIEALQQCPWPGGEAMRLTASAPGVFSPSFQPFPGDAHDVMSPHRLHDESHSRSAEQRVGFHFPGIIGGDSQGFGNSVRHMQPRMPSSDTAFLQVPDNGFLNDSRLRNMPSLDRGQDQYNSLSSQLSMDNASSQGTKRDERPNGHARYHDHSQAMQTDQSDDVGFIFGLPSGIVQHERSAPMLFSDTQQQHASDSNSAATYGTYMPSAASASSQEYSTNPSTSFPESQHFSYAGPSFVSNYGSSQGQDDPSMLSDPTDYSEIEQADSDDDLYC